MGADVDITFGVRETRRKKWLENGDVCIVFGLSAEQQQRTKDNEEQIDLHFPNSNTSILHVMLFLWRTFFFLPLPRNTHAIAEKEKAVSSRFCLLIDRDKRPRMSSPRSDARRSPSSPGGLPSSSSPRDDGEAKIDEEEEGDDLMDEAGIEADYKAIPELDRYEAEGIGTVLPNPISLQPAPSSEVHFVFSSMPFNPSFSALMQTPQMRTSTRKFRKKNAWRLNGKCDSATWRRPVEWAARPPRCTLPVRSLTIVVVVLQLGKSPYFS